MSRLLVPALTGLATAATVAWSMRDGNNTNTERSEDGASAGPVLGLDLGEGAIVGDVKVKLRDFELLNIDLRLLVGGAEKAQKLVE